VAKKKTTTATVVTEDVPDGTVPGVTDGEFSFDTAVDTDLLLEDFRTKGSRVLVKVHKILPGHRPIFQFETDTKVSEVQLQAYGGGLYSISYYIDGVRKHVEEVEVADRLPDNATKPATAESIQIAMLREQSQMNRDLLMAVLGRANPTVPAPTPMSEIAQMWGLIHGLNPAANGTNQLFEALKMGIELASKSNGEMDWKTALISTAKELAPGIIQVAGAAKGVDMKQVGNGTVTVTETPEQLIKHGLNLLKPKIVAGLPVGLALDWVVANASDPSIQPFLVQALGKEFQDLARVDPDVANEPYNSWLRQFLEGLKEHFKQATTDEPEPEPEQ